MKSQKYKTAKKWVIGYIFSRKINSNYIPQKVQNLVIRDYCHRNNFNLILSATEYKSPKSFLMLESLCKKKKHSGVVIYSLSMLMEMKNYWVFLEKFLKKKIILYFALEEIAIYKKKDIQDLKKIFFIKNSNIVK